MTHKATHEETIASNRLDQFTTEEVMRVRDLIVAKRADAPEVNDFMRQLKNAASKIIRSQNEFQDPHVVDEATSEFCFRVLQGIAQFDPQKGEFKAWCSTLLRHAVSDYYRQKKNKPKQFTDEFEHPTTEDSVLEYLIREENQPSALVHDALVYAKGKCPEKSIRAYELMAFDDKQSKEAAAELGETPDYVRKRAERVREHMREYLESARKLTRQDVIDFY